jgi:hypothetical protein
MMDKGKLIERVYRAGTSDGRVPPGLHAEYLRKAKDRFTKARACADPQQAKVLDDLILKIAASAQYFEEEAPRDSKGRKTTRREGSRNQRRNGRLPRQHHRR